MKLMDGLESAALTEEEKTETWAGQSGNTVHA